VHKRRSLWRPEMSGADGELPPVRPHLVTHPGDGLTLPPCTEYPFMHGHSPRTPFARGVPNGGQRALIWPLITSSAFLLSCGGHSTTASATCIFIRGHPVPITLPHAASGARQRSQVLATGGRDVARNVGRRLARGDVRVRHAAPGSAASIGPRRSTDHAEWRGMLGRMLAEPPCRSGVVVSR
jgi:hypothetical protein